MLYPKNLKNIRFGKLIPLEQTGFSKFDVPLWMCKCDCGDTKIVTRNRLVTNKTRSCGCLRVEIQTKRNTTHGMADTRICRIFKGMRKRCQSVDSESYKNYGGRGIQVLWKSFEEFYADMGKSYDEHCLLYGIKDTTIERIDVNGNYCKENCTWATIKEQANNKRRKVVSFKQCICLYCSKIMNRKCK